MKRKIKFKIFQIGFNKCGTTSIHNFFKRNGLKSIHSGSGLLANSIYEQYQNNQPLLNEKYSYYDVFLDMENITSKKSKYPIYIAQSFYKELYLQYPNSKFILNIRNRSNWIVSRIRHDNGNYLKIIGKKYSLNEHEVIEKWLHDWDTHINSVKEFFRDKPSQLLIFDIDTDPIDKLIDFFKNDIILDKNQYLHLNKTI